MNTLISAIPKETDPRDPIGYAVCQQSGCQQTHGLSVLHINYPSAESTRNLKCEKCGGLLTDENGRANLSRNPEIYTTITLEELERQKQEAIQAKRDEIAESQRHLEMLENDEIEDL